MRKIVLTSIGALSILAGALLPTQLSAKTYTCWNPAICKAVCGSTTCGTALTAKSSSSSQSSASTARAARR